MKKVIAVISAPPSDSRTLKSSSTTGPEIRMKMMSDKWFKMGIKMFYIYPKHGLCYEFTLGSNINSDLSINDGFIAFFCSLIKSLRAYKNIPVVHSYGPAKLDLAVSLACLLTKRFHIVSRLVLIKDQIHYSKIKICVYQLIDRLITLQFASRIVVLCTTQYDYMHNVLKVANSKLHLIPNTVIKNSSQKHALRTSHMPEERSSISITMIGQLFPPKGWEGFIKIAQILVHQYELPNVHFNIVGNGPLLNSLQSLSSMYRLDQNITFHGFVSEPSTILSLTDIYLSSSKREGLSVAILEALDHSLPVVATNVGCTCDQVIPFYNGFLYDVNDHQSAAKILESLIRSSTIRKSLGKNSKKLYQTKFSTDQYLQKHISLYNV